MKENAPKKTWFQTLRTLWMPLAIGVVTVAALAVVVGMVWKDYRTAMMDSQTRQMELVVQSTADSIRVLLEEYADRLDSIAGKAEASKAFRPTVARSDTIRDVWLENSNGEVIYSCYGLSAVCDVLITRTEDISYWQYHSGGEHYLVMKKKAGDETACLVVDSTVMYQQLISEIHVGRNGYIMIKNDDNLVVMHPEAVQWGIKVVEGRQRIYQGKELDMSSLSELLRAQQEEESGTLDYYSYWWADPDLPRVHKISAFRHLDVAGNIIDDHQLGSIEYAAGHLGCRLVVVLGHTHCGAVDAAINQEPSGYIRYITDEIKKAIGDETDPYKASCLNVRHSVQEIEKSLCIHNIEEETGLRVVGAMYHIEDGSVEFL